MQYAMFLVLKEVRGKSVGEAAKILTKRLEGDRETFQTHDRFRLHGMNRRLIQRLLARITSYLETASGLVSKYEEYVFSKGKKAYEVEHILADHPELHAEEFPHPSDFEEYRNRIGALLILPKSFNASYGDLAYEEKLPHYLEQNLLAKSLHPQVYAHNPGFLSFVKQSGLAFQPHKTFKKLDIEQRTELYKCLAEQIWDPAVLQQDNIT